jgi:hypothetical protein
MGKIRNYVALATFGAMFLGAVAGLGYFYHAEEKEGGLRDRREKILERTECQDYFSAKEGYDPLNSEKALEMNVAEVRSRLNDYIAVLEDPVKRQCDWEIREIDSQEEGHVGYAAALTIPFFIGLLGSAVSIDSIRRQRRINKIVAKNTIMVGRSGC